MADLKCSAPAVQGTVYKAGKAVSAVHNAEVREHGAEAIRLRRELTCWLPLARRQALLEKAFAAVYRYNIPPLGEPFVDENGLPYSTPEDFADQLAEEFRERLYELLGARDGEEGGQYFLLGELSSERLQVPT